MHLSNNKNKIKTAFRYKIVDNLFDFLILKNIVILMCYYDNHKQIIQ